MSLGQGKEFDALSATEWQPYYSFPGRGHVLGAMGLDKNQKNHRVVEKTCGGGGQGPSLAWRPWRKAVSASEAWLPHLGSSRQV